MPILDPADIADDLVKAVSATKAKYIRNIDKPKRDPKAAALAANDKRVQKLMKSIEDKTWEKAVEAYDVNEARQIAKTTGATALVAGVAARKNKILRFWQRWKPILEEIQAEVRKLPDGTPEERDQRVLENLHRLRAKKGAWR